MGHQLKLIVLVAALLQMCASHKILYATSITSTSHLIPVAALAEGLLEKGHDVTFILHKEFPFLDKGVKQFILTNPIDFVGIVQGSMGHSPVEMVSKLAEVSSTDCDVVSSDERLKAHLKSVRYDVILVSSFFQQCLLATIRKYQKNVPFIIYHPGMLIPEVTQRATGIDIWDTAFIPAPFLDSTDKMNFHQRFLNFFMRNIPSLAFAFALRGQNAILTKNLGPDHEDARYVEQDAAFLFVSSCFEFDYPSATTTETIMTGCLQCRPAKPLPQDLKKIADSSSKHGMIVFSLGSVMSNDVFSDQKLEAFIEAFRRVPQTVIWHSNRKMDNLPPNVIVKKWLPMQDFLGHPNLKVIISHGGFMTLQETFYHGVPYLGLPVHGVKSDRLKNARLAMDRGIGLRLDFDNLYMEDILEKLNRLVNDTSFKANAKRISGYLQDQLVTSKQKAVFYTEYAIRHNGAAHFKSQARHLAFYQIYSLDVIACLGACTVLSLLFLLFLLKFFHRLIDGPSTLVASPKKVKKQ